MNKRKIKKFEKKRYYKKYPDKHCKVLAKKTLRQLDTHETVCNPLLWDISNELFYHGKDSKNKQDTIFIVANYFRKSIKLVVR